MYVHSSLTDVAPREPVQEINAITLLLSHSTAGLLLTIGMHLILTGLMFTERLERISLIIITMGFWGVEGGICVGFGVLVAKISDSTDFVLYIMCDRLE